MPTGHYRFRRSLGNVGSRFRGARPDTYPITTLDPDVLAFAAESGATDLTGLNNLVVYLKGEGLYSDFVIHPMKSAQNAGSGDTVYGLGGISVDLTRVGAPSWAAGGFTINGTTQWFTSTFTGSNTWTEMSLGFRGATDVAGNVDPSPPQTFIVHGDNSDSGSAKTSGLLYGSSAISGETATLSFQDASQTERMASAVTWSAAQDITHSANFKTLKYSRDGVDSPLTISLGTATDYTPSQNSGTSDLIYVGALANAGSPIIPFDGLVVASYVLNAAVTDTQRNQIDTYVAAL